TGARCMCAGLGGLPARPGMYAAPTTLRATSSSKPTWRAASASATVARCRSGQAPKTPRGRSPMPWRACGARHCPSRRQSSISRPGGGAAMEGKRPNVAATTPDLTVQVGPLTLKAPVMPASGCFNVGQEVAHLFDLSCMGAIINKTVMPGPRPGNPPYRVLERTAGLINSIGIPSKGPAEFLEHQLPFMRSLGTRVIVSIGGLSEADYAGLAALMDAQEGIDALELDLSCPNHAER